MHIFQILRIVNFVKKLSAFCVEAFIMYCKDTKSFKVYEKKTEYQGYKLLSITKTYLSRYYFGDMFFKITNYEIK